MIVFLFNMVLLCCIVYLSYYITSYWMNFEGTLVHSWVQQWLICPQVKTADYVLTGTPKFLSFTPFTLTNLSFTFPAFVMFASVLSFRHFSSLICKLYYLLHSFFKTFFSLGFYEKPRLCVAFSTFCATCICCRSMRGLTTRKPKL